MHDITCTESSTKDSPPQTHYRRDLDGSCRLIIQNCSKFNEEQTITGYPIDGAMGTSGGGWIRELLVVCLHNNAIVARGILFTLLYCGTPQPRLSAVYIVSSVGTSLSQTQHKDRFQARTRERSWRCSIPYPHRLKISIFPLKKSILSLKCLVHNC